MTNRMLAALTSRCVALGRAVQARILLTANGTSESQAASCDQRPISYALSRVQIQGGWGRFVKLTQVPRATRRAS